MPWYMRLVALAGAIGLLVPGTRSDLAGIAVLVVMHLFQSMRAKKETPARGNPEEKQ